MNLTVADYYALVQTDWLIQLEPRVLSDCIDSWSFFWVLGQYALDQINDVGADETWDEISAF